MLETKGNARPVKIVGLAHTAKGIAAFTTGNVDRERQLFRIRAS